MMSHVSPGIRWRAAATSTSTCWCTVPQPIIPWCWVSATSPCGAMRASPTCTTRWCFTDWFDWLIDWLTAYFETYGYQKMSSSLNFSTVSRHKLMLLFLKIAQKLDCCDTINSLMRAGRVWSEERRPHRQVWRGDATLELGERGWKWRVQIRICIYWIIFTANPFSMRGYVPVCCCGWKTARDNAIFFKGGVILSLAPPFNTF